MPARTGGGTLALVPWLVLPGPRSNACRPWGRPVHRLMFRQPGRFRPFLRVGSGVRSEVAPHPARRWKSRLRLHLTRALQGMLGLGLAPGPAFPSGDRAHATLELVG